MKKGHTIFVTIDAVGNSTVAAYCLSTDLWQDHLWFLKEAIRLDGENRPRDMNRCLRASLLSVFSHLEGVINQDLLATITLPRVKRLTLADKISLIDSACSKLGRSGTLRIPLEKHFRDILAHPGIKKTIGAKKIDQSSLYFELTVAKLESLSREIDLWLSSACVLLGATRFTDTKRLAEDFAKKLGKGQTSEL